MMLNKSFLYILLIISSSLYAKLNIIVSIAPQETFTKAIGKDKVNISLMVKPGNSPHTYEPKPSQMKDIIKADLYLAIGVEFEKIWLKKFIHQNPKMLVINTDNGVKKYGLDPHIWTSPDNIKIIAKNTLDILIQKDKINKLYYEQNYQNFILSIDKIDTKIKTILKSIPQKSKFMVFHPAWGYFARQYNLIQVPIEIDGKSPKPKDIVQIIKTAKKNNIKAIITAPEFSNKIAKQIASTLNIDVCKISTINPNWSQNLINLATSIAKQK